MQVAQLQIKAGRFFWFEHPQRAASWKLPEVQQVGSLPGVQQVSFDQCMLGLRTKTSGVRMRKRTTIMTNLPQLADAFRGCMCSRDHEHQPMHGNEGGQTRSSWAQCYPPQMVQVIAAACKSASESLA